MNDTFTSMYVTGQHKNKQISDRLEYITHLHQHTWSIHNSYVSKMCIQNIANIFAGFWIRACRKTAKSAKINVPRIFPRLQYFMTVPVNIYIILHQNGVITYQIFLKVVDPICRSISLNITKLCKDEKYTIMMMYMKSYTSSCRL